MKMNGKQIINAKIIDFYWPYPIILASGGGPSGSILAQKTITKNLKNPPK